MPASRTLVWILRIAPAAILAIAALWSLALQRAEMNRDPSPQEWASAREIVRQGFADGDIIRTAPNWADQARAGMYEYPFNVAMHIEDEELFSYNRLWIIADAEHADDALQELPDGYELIDRWEPGPRSAVLLVDIPDPDRVLFDAYTQLEQARVVRDYGDRVARCDLFRRDGWHCGRVDPWLHVTRDLAETGGSLHHCLFVGIGPEIELRIAYPDIELGSHLEGNVGNTMPAIRATRGSAIDFRIEIDGDIRFTLTFGPWDTPFFPFDIDTTDLSGGRHEITFVFGAEDFFDRWECFRARVLR